MGRREVDGLAVTFVSPHARLGGAPKYLEVLLEQLGDGWVRDVICLEAGPLVERLERLGYPVQVVETGSSLRALLGSALALRRLFRRSPPDVVHANGIKAALVAGLATRGSSLPVVWVKHDFSHDGLLARFTAGLCTHVVGVSSAVLSSLGSSPRSPTSVVPPPLLLGEVERDTARRAVRELLRLPPSALVATTIGRFDPYKGHAELLEVAPAIVAHFPAVHFVLVGDDVPSHRGYRESLAGRAATLGLRDSVTFLGFRDDIAQFVAGSDVIVVPSRPGPRGRGREGFGLVGVEALAAGTPVVAYADGAIPETLGDYARLVPPGDRKALGSAVVEVLSNPGRAGLRAQAGSNEMRATFTVSRTTEGMKTAYREAVARARG
jgi:glycosyltransferase involved in cell wall biosynthesis